MLGFRLQRNVNEIRELVIDNFGAKHRLQPYEESVNSIL